MCLHAQELPKTDENTRVQLQSSSPRWSRTNTTCSTKRTNRSITTTEAYFHQNQNRTPTPLPDPTIHKNLPVHNEDNTACPPPGVEDHLFFFQHFLQKRLSPLLPQNHALAHFSHRVLHRVALPHQFQRGLPLCPLLQKNLPPPRRTLTARWRRRSSASRCRACRSCPDLVGVELLKHIL